MSSKNVGLEALKAEYRLTADSCDRWGDCWGVWFAVAGELDWRGSDVPAVEWQFRPGAGGDGRCDPDDMWREVLAGVDTDTLTDFGRLLSRYADKLRVAGASY